MAYIYRYELKSKKNRANEDLRVYREPIIKAVKEHFKNNLKSIEVFSDYYEFRLSDNSPNKTTLQNLSKRILRNCETLNKLKKIYKNNSQLFRRKKNSYYAFLEDIEFSEGTYILKLDAVEQNDIDLIEKNIIDTQTSKSSILQNLDTFTVYTEIDTEHFLFEKLNNIKDSDINQWYLLEGEHHKEGETSFFQDYTERQDTVIEYKISSLIKVGENKLKFLERFSSEEGIYHQEITKFEKTERDFFISIYNVGQGLCSAICNLQSQPLLYFDFGGGEGKNNITYPKDIKFCFKKRPKIVLSHFHRDHWISVSYFNEALKTEWIIPSQKHGTQFTKLLSDISSKGKLVILKQNDREISNPYGKLFIASGKPNHPHNNGLSFLVETADNKRYLMPGDNRYQYIPSEHLVNLNGLIASHHGGKYYENSNGKAFIPLNTTKGYIVYSYGKHSKFRPKNNSYGHPSYIHKYVKKKWVLEMHTSNRHCYLGRPIKYTKCPCGCNL